MPPSSSTNPLAPLGSDALLEFPCVSRETLDRFQVYADMLQRWQGRMNLVSRDGLGDLWRRHFLDSLQLVNFLGPDDRVITDLGSGAGFPGLVLAAALDRDTHLVEANARKCVFLREVAREIGAPATVHQARIEHLDPWPTDVIVARALAPLEVLLGMAAVLPSPAPRTRPLCLFLKGRNVASELTRARKVWNMRAHRTDSLSDPAGCVLSVSDFTKIR